MKLVQAAEAQTSLSVLITETATSHEPIYIAGEHEHAVLIGEEDWRAIQETLYLAGIPGMRQSILRGLKTPVEKCDKGLDW